MRFLFSANGLSAVWLAGTSLALMTANAQRTNAAPAAAPIMLPDRLLTCAIGHVTNFDVHIEQSPGDLHNDGVHHFTLFLPAIALDQGPPPDAIEKAPLVDPRTRIVSDPDHISGQPTNHFDRIVDWWPDRVELSANIEGPLLNAIVIHPIDAERGTASVLMLRATELTHFQPDQIYQGSCHIVTGEMARNGGRPSS
jgi:hypothetical protein